MQKTLFHTSNKPSKMKIHYSYFTYTFLIFAILCSSCASTQIPANPPSPSSSDAHQHSVEQDSFFFAYAKSDKDILGLANAESDPPSYKFKTVMRVLARLIMARGDKRSQKPKLVMSKKQRYVAYMNSRTVEIGIEEKAYDICAALGPDSLNALAVLLGHEIVHYYEKHNWTNNFAKKNLEIETGRTLKKIANVEGLSNETQADYLGGFLGYSAGFNTLGLMPKVLKNLYEGYGLPDSIPGYPSLQERGIIANNSMVLLEELAHVFDMANYLSAIGDYTNARIHYKRVLKDFQSREIYNNMGVVSFLEALDLFESKDLKYGYPIELDTDTRLSLGTRGSMGFADVKEKREALLREAIDNFDQATTLDKEYAVGFLNLACAHSLLGETDEAELFAARAKRFAKKQDLKVTEADAWIIKGIVAEQLEDNEQAKENFTKAVEMGSTLAATNLKIMNEESLEITAGKTFGFSSKVERIDDIVLKNFLDNITFDLDNGDKKIEVERDYYLYVVKKNNSKIYLAHNENEGSHTSFLMTNKDYTGTTTNFGISLGDEASKISKDENFGPVSTSVGTNRGRYLIYPKKKILFITNENNKLSQWATYNVFVPE
jgi:tetratricopeptide (TPR) repeat protein